MLYLCLTVQDLEEGTTERYGRPESRKAMSSFPGAPGGDCVEFKKKGFPASRLGVETVK